MYAYHPLLLVLYTMYWAVLFTVILEVYPPQDKILGR